MSGPDPYDPEALRWSGDGATAIRQPPAKLPRHRPGEAFVKGPIPWTWLVTAARLPGRSLQVALLLWKLAGCRKSRTVPFCLSRAAEVGVKWRSARRALQSLQNAGLVAIRHQVGRGLEVTLLETQPSP
jgi:hypothetical protein